MINSRKTDHIKICIEEDVEEGDPGFDSIKLPAKALPEIDFNKIDTTKKLFNKDLKIPLIIESMTGGTKKAALINKALASFAQEYGLGMGVGSQRAAIDDKSLIPTFQVRKEAPDILLFANLGVVQLNHGYSKKEIEAALDMIDADAIFLHVNPLQEVIQPEGDRDFSDIISKVNKVSKDISKPVIIKGVGEGITGIDASLLMVDGFDTGGTGGTSWSKVESYRVNGLAHEVGKTFAGWGIPTIDCIRELRPQNKPLIASGGIRNGLDGAKSIALGADAFGIALPFLRIFEQHGSRGLKEYVERIIKEFKIAMFLTGCKSVKDLKGLIE